MDGKHEAAPVDPGAIPRPRGAVEPMPSVPARRSPSRGVVDNDRGRVLARYARLMRSADDIATGYKPVELDRWAAHAHDWAVGRDIAALPHVAAPQPQAAAREVFVFFISAAKHRNPAAAMALQSRVDSTS